MSIISDEFLLDHASGAASAPVSLLVASHLTLNPEARRSYRRLEALGGVMLEQIEAAPTSPDALERIMARLDAAEPATVVPVETIMIAGLPAPLGRYVAGGVDSLPWRQVTRGVEEAALPISGSGGEKATLLRIAAGRAIPKHTHRGLEMTLVLDGAFDDEAGHYGRGDVCVADVKIEHQPVAAIAKDCLCLVVASSPIRLTGKLLRLLNPFLTR
jgi:putative transcriptional regulator